MDSRPYGDLQNLACVDQHQRTLVPHLTRLTPRTLDQSLSVPQPPAMVNGPQRMAPKPLAVMKDTSSSSGKVFAKPSKEWVVPERTKPGRKISAEEPDNVSGPPALSDPSAQVYMRLRMYKYPGYRHVAFLTPRRNANPRTA